MSERKINTTITLKQSAKPEAEIQAELRRAQKASKGKMVELLIPEVYKAAFGDPVMFSVNGIRIEIPIGKTVTVPSAHAKHAHRLMKAAVLTKSQKRLTPSEVYKN
jgi:hypothetical protein